MTNEMKAIFLDTTDGKVYTKVWGGLTFSVTRMSDDSIKVKAHDQDTEIIAVRDGEFGPYWVANVYGGKGFVSFKPSKQGDGDYCLLKLTEEVRLPRNPNKTTSSGGGQKKTYSSSPKKTYGNKSWAK